MIYLIYDGHGSENSSCIHYKSEKLMKLMKIFEHVHRPKSQGVLSQTQEIGPILDKLTEVVLPHYLCDQKVTRQGNVSQIPPPCDVTKCDNLSRFARSRDVTSVMWCNSGDNFENVAWVTSRHACHISWPDILLVMLCLACHRHVKYGSVTNVTSVT